MSLNLTNPLGYAEQISASAEYGSQSTNVYSLGVTKPRPSGLPLLVSGCSSLLGSVARSWALVLCSHGAECSLPIALQLPPHTTVLELNPS